MCRSRKRSDGRRGRIDFGPRSTKSIVELVVHTMANYAMLSASVLIVYTGVWNAPVAIVRVVIKTWVTR